MLGSSDDSRGSSPRGNSPQASPPPVDPLDSCGTDAESVAEMCKAALDKDSVVEQELVWWETWVKRWNEEFVLSFHIRDEDAKTEEARRVRKMCKDAKTPKDETALQVQEALAQLRFVVPPCPPPHLPPIEDDFPKAQLALYEQRTTEAGRRIDAIKHSIERDEKADDDVAISKAMLADAKLKVMAKKPKFLKMLRLPVKDYVCLKEGTGARRGVTSFMGNLLEEYRQKQNYEGELVLRQKDVDDEWAAQIGKAIEKQIGQLHSLDLACNKFGNEGVRDLARGISQSSTLTRLNLGVNKLDRVGLDYIADSLLVNTTITDLSLNSLKFGALLEYVPPVAKSDAPPVEDEDLIDHANHERAHGHKEESERERARRRRRGDVTPVKAPSPPKIVYQAGLGRMLETLIVTNVLRKLDIAGNRMGPVLFGQLCESLSLNQTIRWLNIAGNSLGPDGGAHLGRLLAASQRIRYIDACSNMFGAEGADYLSLQIDTNTGLTDLRLSSNKMAIEGSPWLGQILKYCQCLVHLDIAGNDVDEVSSQSLRDAFEGGEFTNLTVLKLSQNPIGDKGMLHIAQGLGGLAMLRSLQIFNCEITDPGAAAIGAAAASMPYLRKLEVAYNRISHEGFKLITEWLLAKGSRYRLTDLNIDGNVCGDEVVDSFERLLDRGPFLQRLLVRGNFLTMQAVQRVIELAQQHENLLQVELAGNLDKGDPVAKRELGYLANLLEERALFLNAEANTSNVDPFGRGTPLFSAYAQNMTPGLTTPASPLAQARGLFDMNHMNSRALPIATQIRLARLAAYSSPLNGYSPMAIGEQSPVKPHWRAGGAVFASDSTT